MVWPVSCPTCLACRLSDTRFPTYIVDDMPSWHDTSYHSYDPRPEPGQVGSRVVRFLEVLHFLEM